MVDVAAVKMWPRLLDMSRDESKRVLRRVELEAYASVISAFRAQGDLTSDKRKLLQDLQHILSISTERHRAEVRRAVNDEKLSTIADQISCSSNTSSEWVVEGRRLIPLMPRLVPQTAFTATANQAANVQAEKNSGLPLPATTGNKDVNMPPIPPPPTPVPKVSRPSSPTSNVVVLPSGASIHIKGMLEEEEELQSRRRRSRSLSTESQSSSVGTQTAQGPTFRPAPTGPSPLPSISPVKITISKSPQGRAIVSQSGTQPPKVILVTSSGHSVSPSVLQRSMSVPIVRATTSTCTSGTPRPSVVVPSSSPVCLTQSGSSLPNVITVNSSAISTSTLHPPAPVTTATTIMGTPTNPLLSGGMLKPRTKLIPRQRFAQPQPKPGVVIPSGPQPVAPSPQTLGVVPGLKGKPTIQIKQEGGMRIITQSLPAGTSKILPKPPHLPGTSTPVVVVNAGGPTGSPAGGKVLNITPGGRVITSSKASNVVTVNPKTLHLTAVKTPAGTTVSKPNVIVVQKTQPRRSQTPTTSTLGSKQATTIITNPAGLERELAHLFQNKELSRQVSVTVATAPSTATACTTTARSQERKVIITTASAAGESLRQGIPILQRAKVEEGKTSSLLAELIQAAGIIPEGSMDPSGGAGGNEWFEYDMEDSQAVVGHSDPGETATLTTTGLSVQHQLPALATQPLPPQPEVIEVGSPSFYTMEHAMSLLGGPEKGGVLEAPVVSLTSQPSVSLSKSLLQGESLLSGTMKPMALPLAVETVVSLPEHSMEGLVSASLDGQGGQLDPQTGLFYSVATDGTTPLLSSASLLHQHGSIITTAPITVTRIPMSSALEGLVASRPATQRVTVGSGTGAVTAVAHPLASAGLATPSPMPGGDGQQRAMGEDSGANLPRSTGQPVDLLSSSLAEAQIDLDTYELMDEGLQLIPQPASQPLQPAPQPLQSAPQPLQLASQPLYTARQSLQSAPQPLQPAPQPLQSTSQTLQSASQTLQSASQPLQSAPQPLQLALQPLQVVSHPPLQPSRAASHLPSPQSAPDLTPQPPKAGPEPSSQPPQTAPHPAPQSTPQPAPQPSEPPPDDGSVDLAEILMPEEELAETCVETTAQDSAEQTLMAPLPASSSEQSLGQLASLSSSHSGMVLPAPGPAVSETVSGSGISMPASSSTMTSAPSTASLTVTEVCVTSSSEISTASATSPESYPNPGSKTAVVSSSSATEFRPATVTESSAASPSGTTESRLSSSPQTITVSSIASTDACLSSGTVGPVTVTATVTATGTADSGFEVMSSLQEAASAVASTDVAPATTTSIPSSYGTVTEVPVSTYSAPLDNREFVDMSALDTCYTPAQVVVTSASGRGIVSGVPTSFGSTAEFSAPARVEPTSTGIVTTSVEVDSSLVEVDSSLVEVEASPVVVDSSSVEVESSCIGMDSSSVEVDSSSMGVVAASVEMESTSVSAPGVAMATSGTGGTAASSSASSVELVRTPSASSFLSASPLGSSITTTVPAVLSPATTRPKLSTFIPLESVTRLQAPINVVTRTQPSILPAPSMPSSSMSPSLGVEQGGVEQGVVEVLAEKAAFRVAQGEAGGQGGGREGAGPSLPGVGKSASLLVSLDTSEQAGGEEVFSGELGGSGGESQGDLDLASQRSSKRKRRAPSGLEEAALPSSLATGSWVRSALGILQRVSRYRGVNREKGDINASAWFLQPVDKNDVPDYYTIIKTPMDFGTIRKKLETGQYLDIEEFHADMLLVRDNCELYNPSHCQVRRDCSDVFAFYTQEWDRLMEKWQRTHTGSPGASKKPRLDKSPSKS